MAGIKQYLDNILNAIYGKDVRQSIHDAIEQTYEDAATEGNANMEVSAARGNYDTLKKRLDAEDGKINNNAININKNASNLEKTVKKDDTNTISMEMLTQEVKEAMTGAHLSKHGK